MLSLVVGSSTDARANGRFPASSAAVFGSDTVLVRTTFGVVVSKDHGKSWDFICERAIGFSGIEDPTYVITKSGVIAAGTFEGLAVSRDGGCEWTIDPSHVFSDLALRADGVLFGMHSVYAKTTDAGLRYESSIWMSKDDAKTFERVGGAIDDSLLLETIEVADSDPQRIVLSAVRGEGADRKGALLVSKDGGQHFTETPIPFEKGERGVYIGAIDPKDADRVYTRTSGDADTASRLIAFDHGKASVIHTAATPLAGFALSPDGTRIYAGSRAGVWTASVGGTFSEAAKFEVQCLGANGEAVLACSNERSGFFVGRAGIDAKKFEPALHLNGLRGLLSCKADSTVGKQCAGEWPKLRRELGIPDEVATLPSAVPSSAPTTQPVRRGSAIGLPAVLGGLLVAAAILYFALRSKKA